MIDFRVQSRIGSRIFVVFAVMWLAACGGNKAPETPPGTVPPDQFLFERANDAVKRERWADARKYFQQIVDNYPQSTIRPDAKIGSAIHTSMRAAKRTSYWRRTNSRNSLRSTRPAHGSITRSTSSP